MSKKEQLKQSIIKALDQSDEKVLRMVQSILQIDQEYDFWDDLPEHVKNEVEESIEQGERGEGKSHEDVIKKYF